MTSTIGVDDLYKFRTYPASFMNNYLVSDGRPLVAVADKVVDTYSIYR